MNNFFQAFCSFSANKVVHYVRNVSGRFQSGAHLTSGFNQVNGNGSMATRSKISNAVNWLLFLSDKKKVFVRKLNKYFDFRLTFITLTLSNKQFHDDDYIKRNMLAAFIRWMERKHQGVFWLWKAEAQQNGNIHFHITTNVFIHWRTIRHKWNEIQLAHGYLTNTDDGNYIGTVNSTDVHAVYNVQSIGFYIAKYFTKKNDYCNYVALTCSFEDKAQQAQQSFCYVEEDGFVYMRRRSISGRQWAACQYLSSKGISFEQGSLLYDYMLKLVNAIPDGDLIRKDYVSIQYLKPYNPSQLPRQLLDIINEHLNGALDVQYLPSRYEVYSLN
jgi:hypothetical protein